MTGFRELQIDRSEPPPLVVEQLWLTSALRMQRERAPETARLCCEPGTVLLRTLQSLPDRYGIKGAFDLYLPYSFPLTCLAVERTCILVPPK